MSRLTRLKKEAGFNSDVKDVGKKAWKYANTDHSAVTKKIGDYLDKGSKSFGEDVSRGYKVFKKNRVERKIRNLKKELPRETPTQKQQTENLNNARKKIEKKIKRLGSAEDKSRELNKKTEKKYRKIKKSNKKMTKELARDRTSLAKKTLAGGAVVGTVGGAGGAAAYFDSKKKDKPELGKVASVQDIDKEAAGLLGLTSGVGKFFTKQRGYGIPGTNIGSKLFKTNRLRNANLAAKNTPERAAKLEKLTKIRADKASAVSSARARHTAENAGTSGNYKGMEKTLAKRQKAELAEIDAKYRADAGMKIRGPRKGAPLSTAQKEQRRIKNLNKKKDPMDRINMKQNFGPPKPGFDLNRIKTPKAVVPNKGAVNLGPMKVTPPTPRRGATDLGAMGPVKPATIAPANNSIPGTGFKTPAMTAQNFKRGAYGAVGLTAGSQVYDGFGGGSNRRVINNY